MARPLSEKFKEYMEDTIIRTLSENGELSAFALYQSLRNSKRFTGNSSLSYRRVIRYLQMMKKKGIVKVRRYFNDCYNHKVCLWDLNRNLNYGKVSS